MRVAVACLLALLSQFATADQRLVFNGAQQSSVLTLHTNTGDTWTCNFTNLALLGEFNNLGQAVVYNATSEASGCTKATGVPTTTPVVVVPISPGVKAVFSKATYAASAAAGVTYITVNRSPGDLSGISVPWSATGNGPVTPVSGMLFWGQGDTTSKFIKLSFTKGTSSVKLILPGTTATLTIVQ